MEFPKTLSNLKQLDADFATVDDAVFGTVEFKQTLNSVSPTTFNRIANLSSDAQGQFDNVNLSIVSISGTVRNLSNSVSSVSWSLSNLSKTVDSVSHVLKDSVNTLNSNYSTLYARVESVSVVAWDAFNDVVALNGTVTTLSSNLNQTNNLLSSTTGTANSALTKANMNTTSIQAIES